MSARRRSPATPNERVIYIRKSTTAAGLDQTFASLEAQRDACLADIQRQGWELVDEHHDVGGVTGADADRPVLQRLLADLDAGRIHVVVVDEGVPPKNAKRSS